MVKRFLVDSSIISKYLNGLLPEKGYEFMDSIFEIESNISIITKIELLSWTTTDKMLYQQIEIFIEDSTIYSLSDEVAQKTIALRRKYRMKTPDAIIGATALIHQLTLLTDNERDFRAIKSLKVFNPTRL